MPHVNMPGKWVSILHLVLPEKVGVAGMRLLEPVIQSWREALWLPLPSEFPRGIRSGAVTDS